MISSEQYLGVIIELKNMLDEERKKTTKLNTELIEKDKSLAGINKELLVKTDTISKLNEALKERNTEISNLYYKLEREKDETRKIVQNIGSMISYNVKDSYYDDIHYFKKYINHY